MKSIIFIAAVLALASLVEAHEFRNYLGRPSLEATTNVTSSICKIKFFAYDQQNWKNLSYGLMQGLYTNPPDPCLQC